MGQRTALWLAFVVSAVIQAQPGIISTVAGTGIPLYSGDGGPATQASIYKPQGVAMDRFGNIYIADSLNFRIRKMDASGTIQTVAGCGLASIVCPPEIVGSRRATDVALSNPASVTVDAAGNFYVSDSVQNRILKVSTSGIATIFAGIGGVGVNGAGFAGDGRLAITALLNNPGGLTMDAADNLYFADRGNNRVRKVDRAGIITTIAGTGDIGYNSDNIPAVLANLWEPQGVGVDAFGNVYIADTTNYRVRKVSREGIISTVAGNGFISLPPGDGGLATNASLVPWDVKLDPAGNLYISDWQGQRIRKVDVSTTIIRTIAGTGRQGYSGDSLLAVNAMISLPTGLVLDGLGSVYFADNGNNRIRKVTAGPLGSPRIRLVNPVQSSFMGQAGLSSNTHAEIYGSDFSETARVWAARDFNGPNAPTSLNGVRVTVNNKPAFISYVSPLQININMPDDTATGPVDVRVQTALGSSNTVLVDRSRVSPTLQTDPAFHLLNTQYVVAFTPDFKSYIGPDTLAGGAFVRAKPGDAVTIYALGLGPTNPATLAGMVAAATSNVTLPLEIKIGGVPASVPFAAHLKDTIGLYQLNVVIPNVPAGDQKIELTVDGISNNQNLYIMIGP